MKEKSGSSDIAIKLKKCFKRGSKVLLMGNGGSATQADHMASELLTHGMPAISLCHAATITALANDYNYSEVFSKQIKVLGKKGDIVIGFSTSGKSKNILQGYKEAKKMGLETIDWPRFKKPSGPTDVASIQEAQLFLMHNVYLGLI